MKIDDLITQLNSLTVMEAVLLAKELERRWGVSSAIRINIFNPEVDKPNEENGKYEFDVIMEHCGNRKIEVIKILRMLIPNLGLKEAKDIAENSGCAVFQKVGMDFAYQAKKQLEEAGATIKII